MTAVVYPGKSVVLRPLERDDWVRSLAWVNDAEVAPRLGRCRPVTTDEHMHFYERAVLDPSNVFFAIEARDGAEHVGNIWLWNVHPQNRNAELRVLVGCGRGRGWGSEAVGLLLDFAFNALNLHKVYLYVLASNEPAVKAFGRNGFECEGTLREEFFLGGAYVDVLRMALTRTRWNLKGEN